MGLNKTDNLQSRVAKLERLVFGPYLDVLIEIVNPIAANTPIDIQTVSPDYTVETPAPGFRNLMDTADEFYRNAKLQIYLDGLPQGKGVTRAVEWVSATAIKFHGPLYPGMSIKIWFTPLSEDLYLYGGLSAYQIALLEGFVGTEEEWILSLKGDQGDQGPPGIQGPPGPGGGGGSGNGFTVTPVKTANYTAVAFDAVPFDSNSGSFTITLPASPAHGDQVEILEVGGAADVNPVTIDRNGNSINGIASNVSFNVNYQKITLTFVTSFGWIMV